MATSVIDYVFRDLAISYLKRTDLGQVKPEDLQTTGAGGSSGEATDSRRGENANPVLFESNAGPHEPAPEPARRESPASGEAAKIALARVKGYEGDPCPACGSFTLVRSGTCMKCDTCGGTTGCS
jgi:ribonucleoside-diphosphate reductase alpha chain